MTAALPVSIISKLVDHHPLAAQNLNFIQVFVGFCTDINEKFIVHLDQFHVKSTKWMVIRVAC
jgi:hypothetical protein